MATPENLVRWRNEFRQLHETIERGREEFEAWFEETALLEAEIEIGTEELRQIVTDIKKDRQQYRELLTQIPNVDDFSDEEVEKRSGKASLLLDIASQIGKMEFHLPRKVEKLRFLVEKQDSLDKAERSAKRIKEFLGNTKAHSVKGDLVKKFIVQRQAEGAANATINRELAFLKRAFNLGIEAEKIVRKPYIPQLKEDNVRSGFFEYPEFVAVRGACPEYFKPVVTFAYYRWRKENILELHWNQVDFATREVRLNAGTTKNEEGCLIMLDGELLETLQAQWEKRKVAEVPGYSPTLLCPYVFHRSGRAIRDIRDVWHNACIAVGLGQMVEVERDGKKKKKYEGKLFHDFRRTARRDNIRAGINEKVAMQMSGHKTRSGFDRYNIVSPDDLREAARRRWTHTQEQEEKPAKLWS
jgi:hypothetical protein